MFLRSNALTPKNLIASSKTQFKNPIVPFNKAALNKKVVVVAHIVVAYPN